MRFDYQLPKNVWKYKISSNTLKKLALTFTVGAVACWLAFEKGPIEQKDPSVTEQNVVTDTSIKTKDLFTISTMKSLRIRDYKVEKNKVFSKLESSHLDLALQKPPHSDAWRSVTVNKGDSLAKIFSNLNLNAKLLDEILQSDPRNKLLQTIHPGQQLDFLYDKDDNLQEIKFQSSPSQTLRIKRTSNGFKSYQEEKQLTKKLHYKYGIIEDSFYLSARKAGLNDKIIMQLAEIFSCEIDFNLDIRNGDAFQIIYEEEYLDSKVIDSGDILAVEFWNKGKAHKAIKYNHGDKNGYYSPEGFSLQKAFLRTPVKFSRISSHFSSAREHPVLHKIRAHKGVDYAAPIGTPIKATGDGKVTWVGHKGGYGKSIEIKHGQKYSTFYAHLSKYHHNLKIGTVVKQGDIIGYVGRTGLASGAHLHYEFRINGIHTNPLTVKLPQSLPVPENHKDEFKSHAKTMLSMLSSFNLIKPSNNKELS